MICRTCWDTGREPIAAELRGRMFAELAQYVAPKLRAIERRGEAEAPRFLITGTQEAERAEEWERRNNPGPTGKLQ
jgi:hypothetical protein